MKSVVLYTIYVVLLSNLRNVSTSLSRDNEDQLNLVRYSQPLPAGDGNFSKSLRKKSVDQKRFLGRSEVGCAIAEERTNTIIKTKESQAAGAVFIPGPAVTNRDECITECCRAPSCNTAVIKEKGEQLGCYLFDCGVPSICLFSAHPGYSVVTITNNEHVASSEFETDKHVNELAYLASSTVTGPATAEPSVSTLQSRKKVLYAFCQSSDECRTDQHLECLNSYCVCQQGYHIVGSVCRMNCNRFQFECVNKEDPSLAECIAVYDRCNGIAQCRDESDELLCSEEQKTVHSAEDDQHRSNSNQEVQKQPDKLDSQKVPSLFSNSTGSSLVEPSAVFKDVKSNFQLESPEVDGVPGRVKSENQVSSQTAERTSGNSRLLAKNTDDQMLTGKEDFVGDQVDRLADTDAGHFEGTDGFPKSSTSRGDSRPAYSNRKIGRFGHKIPDGGEISYDGNALGGPDMGGDGTRVGGYVGSKQTSGKAAETNAKSKEDAREKEDAGGIKFATSRGKPRLGIDDSPASNGESRIAIESKSMQKLKVDGATNFKGNTPENVKSKIDGRYRGKGLPEDSETAKLGSKAENLEALRSGGYLGNVEENLKSAERYRDRSSLEEPSSSVEEERHRLDLLNRQNSNSRPLEQYPSRNKERGFDSPDMSSSDSQYENVRGRSSTSDDASPSKFVNPKLRTFEGKHSGATSDNVKSSIHGGSQSQWLEDDKLQNSGSPDLNPDRYRPYAEMEAKSSRDKDNLKPSKLQEAELSMQPDLSETVLKNRVRPLRPVHIQDVPIDDRLDKDTDPYQDRGDAIVGGKTSGRYQPLDPSERPSDPSLDRYPSNIVAGGSDRTGQIYGYGGRYNDADPVPDRYIDGQVDVAMPYDRVHVPPELSGQPISRGQWYGYGHDGYGHDAYGDSAYVADDYSYGGMARQPSHGYGHPAGGASYYDYFNADDGGPPSPQRKKIVRLNPASTNGRGGPSGDKGTRKLADHAAAVEKIAPQKTRPATESATKTVLPTSTSGTTAHSSTTLSVIPSTVLPTSKLIVSTTVDLSTVQSKTLAPATLSPKSSPAVTRKYISSSKSEQHRSLAPLINEVGHHEDATWLMPGTHGAVIALSLGIVMTATLLLYAGCRFRRLRKMASRRRRPVGNSDADYLINGMYL